MKGYGLTVFSGETPERFEVEILGVLENAGPRQSIILGRLSGGPLAHTGVMQGMSGSPVYLDGKLAGAVALAFNMSKDPIAGIRPFEEMLEPQAVNRPLLRASNCTPLDPGKACEFLSAPPKESMRWGDVRLEPIATPVSFSGFTAATLEHFAPQLRALGLEPRQGVSGGAGARLPQGDPSTLKPGAMISAQLVSGDMSVGADGTVTAIDGKRVYAFGHRFVSMGEVEVPFAAAEVLTLLPNLQTSFKISTARRWIGSLTSDYSTAVRGELGRKPRLIPATITITSGARRSSYKIDLIRDPAFTPFLLQMTTFAAIDATERTAGAVAYTVRQKVAFTNGTSTRAANVYSGEFNIPVQASQSAAIPVAYAMQTGFADLEVASVEVDIDASTGRRTMQIEDIAVGRRTVRPSETVPIHITFASEGVRTTRTISYRVPEGASTGTINFTVADAAITNLMEFRGVVLTPPRNAPQVLKLMDSLRDNTKAFVRVWRAEPAWQAQGEDLPDPPPSVANIYARSQGATIATNYSSKLAEIEVPIPGYMVSGAKTVSVEVKE